MTGDVVDAVVIGAGIAGLMAAVQVAEAGASVVVLEASPEEYYICSSRLTGGVFHCALRAPDTTPDRLEQAIVKGRGAGGNPDLAHAVAHDVIPAIRWLQAHGVCFIRATPDVHQRFVLAPPALGRTGTGWRRRGGDVLLRRLGARLIECGGRIERDCRVRSLVLGATGSIQGVEGDDFRIAARVVVIADGGFQHASAMVAAAISPAPDRLVQRNGGTGWGDGCTMVSAIGGAIDPDLRGFYGHVLSRDALTREELRFYPWLDQLARHGMAVGPDGHRFCDEGRGGIHLANRIAALADPASATVIWDDAIWRGPGRARFMAPNPHLVSRGATVFQADTIGELASKAGIEARHLEREVQAYNAAVSSGLQGDLTPPRSGTPESAMPIATPPYFAAPAAAGMTYTMGGIVVDQASRVRRVDGDVFSNLFAIGGSSAGIEGGPRPMYVGGLAKASATAWRAGQTIIQLLRETSLTAIGTTIIQTGMFASCN